MNNRDCFSNENELCQYLDGEIIGLRKAILDNHIEVCSECSNRFSAWDELKNVVRNSLDSRKAPQHLKERISNNIIRIADSSDKITWDYSIDTLGGNRAYPF